MYLVPWQPVEMRMHTCLSQIRYSCSHEQGGNQQCSRSHCIHQANWFDESYRSERTDLERTEQLSIEGTFAADL